MVGTNRVRAGRHRQKTYRDPEHNTNNGDFYHYEYSRPDRRILVSRHCTARDEPSTNKPPSSELSDHDHHSARHYYYPPDHVHYYPGGHNHHNSAGHDDNWGDHNHNHNPGDHHNHPADQDSCLAGWS